LYRTFYYAKKLEIRSNQQLSPKTLPPKTSSSGSGKQSRKFFSSALCNCAAELLTAIMRKEVAGLARQPLEEGL
jgi:hypothetical protein